MVISKILCAVCGKEIEEKDPSIALKGNVFFFRDRIQMTHGAKKLDIDLCEQCGMELVTKLSRKSVAKEWIFDWNGKEWLDGPHDLLRR